jgi:hypothetical protein
VRVLWLSWNCFVLSVGVGGPNEGHFHLPPSSPPPPLPSSRTGKEVAPPTPTPMAMHAPGKRLKVEMGTGAGARGDNTQVWFGPIKKVNTDTQEYLVLPEETPGSQGRWVHRTFCALSTSSTDEARAPRSRGKVHPATLKRVQIKLDMDQEATLRAKDKEIACAFLVGEGLGLLEWSGLDGEGRIYRHCRFGEDRAH